MTLESSPPSGERCDHPPRATIWLIAVEDAPALTELLQVSRAFLAPWDPRRPDDYFTVDALNPSAR